MAGRLRKDASTWVTETVGGCSFSYLSKRAKDFTSTNLMRMILDKLDDRTCKVPYNQEVKFTVILVAKDYKICNCFIMNDCGTPRTDKLIKMSLLATLSQSMPRLASHTVYDESLIFLEVRTVNTKIVECKLRVEKGTEV